MFVVNVLTSTELFDPAAVVRTDVSPEYPATLREPLKVPLAPLISPANLAVPPTILNSSELISPLLLSIIPVLVYPSVPTVGTLEPVCIFVELIVQPPTRPASLISAFSCGTTSTSPVL